MKETISFGLSMFALLCVVTHCGTTSQQRGAIEDAACSVVEAFSGSPEAAAICATATELAELAATVKAARQDAGAGSRRVTACKIIPTTATCATDAELAAGIAMVTSKRKDPSITEKSK